MAAPTFAGGLTMPRATTSAYRLDARRRGPAFAGTFRAALAALPPGASEAEKRRAVRAACPYLPRQTGDGGAWPYPMWLKEVRADWLYERGIDLPREGLP